MNTPEFKQTRVRLDSWRFWMVVAYVGLAIILGCVIYLFSKQSQDESDRRAAAKVANTAQVTSCISSYRQAPNTLRVLDLLDVLADNSIQANEEALKADPTGPLAQIRKNSLLRLKPAVPTIRLFRETTILNQRTLKQCQELAFKLDVPIGPLLDKTTKGER